MERRLTTIVAADLAGFSRLMAADEEGVIRRLRAARGEVIVPAVDEAGGRIIKTMGDGLLLEFPSPVVAVRAVIAIQEAIAARETGSEDQRLRFRVGVNLGDVVEDGDDILGDGVNVAARLEQLSAAGGAVISRSVYDQLRGKVDVTLIAMGPQRVKNIPDPIDAWRIDIAGAAAAPMSFDLPENPSIVVLPFVNISPDPDQEFFCDGLVEDVTTALSRFSQLFVIARNTAFTLKGRTMDVREVSRSLGVKYVLEGSVRSAGRRLRVNAQLIDAIEDRHVWAEKYDGDIEDIFAFQDDLTERIVTAVAPQVRTAEIVRSRRKSTPDLGVWELVARAQGEIATFTAASLAAAERNLVAAIARDPVSADAYSALAFTHAMNSLYGWARPPAESLRLAIEAGERAVDLEPANAEALTHLGTSYFISRRHDDGVELLRRALKANPNLSLAMGALGMVLVWMRRFEEGTELLHRSIRLSPNDPLNSLRVAHLGFEALMNRRFQDALDFADEALRLNPRSPTALRFMAAAQGHLGMTEAARETLARLETYAPAMTIARVRVGVPYVYEEDFEIFAEGMRLAGMPE